MRMAPIWTLVGITALACAVGGPGPPSSAALDAYPPEDLATCPSGISSLGDAPLDVAMLIDVSVTTREPSGADIDADGEVDAMDAQQLSRLINEGSPDSNLAAEVVAARAIVTTMPDGMRVALVQTGIGGPDRHRQPQASLVTPLTSDVSSLELGLARILDGEENGRAHFSQGMELAIRELDRPDVAPRALVIFLSGMYAPVMHVGRDRVVRGDPGAKEAVLEARRLGIVFHTFGLGEAARTPSPHLLSRIAEVTGGRYVAVTSPGLLHCALAEALANGAP